MPTIIAIETPDDPRIAAYRAVRERDIAGREGVFIAEGEVVLNLLLRAPRQKPLSLLIAEKRIAGLADLLALVPDSVPVYSATQPVLDGIVGFPIHRGILALGERLPLPDPGDLLAGLGPEALVVVLSGIGNHDNMGGLFRNAAAFGIDAVLLDSDCCDPLYRKAIRVSVGATLLVPTARLPRGADMVDILNGWDVLSLSPGGATPLARLRKNGRTAVIFGSEGPGLPAEILARTRTVTIPMAAGFDSLNVATTSGIVLHHLTQT